MIVVISGGVAMPSFACRATPHAISTTESHEQRWARYRHMSREFAQKKRRQLIRWSVSSGQSSSCDAQQNEARRFRQRLSRPAVNGVVQIAGRTIGQGDCRRVVAAIRCLSASRKAANLRDFAAKGYPAASEITMFSSQMTATSSLQVS